MRTPLTRFERAAGLFLGAAFMLGSAAVLATGHKTNILALFSEGFVFHAIAKAGHNAAVGSPVKVHGVEVGTVTAVQLVHLPEHPDMPVQLTIRIEPHAASFLGSETVAYVVEPALGSGMPPFGTASIELRSAGSGQLAKGSTVVAEGEESLVQTIAHVGRDVSALKGQLDKAIEELGSSFTNMRKLTDSLADGKGVAARLINEPDLANELEGALHDARAATGDARRLMGDLSKVSRQAPEMMSDARSATQEAQKALVRVNGALESLPKLIASTERTLVITEELLKQLRTSAGYAPDLVRKVDVSLDEANRLVEAAQQNFLIRSTLPDRPAVRTDAQSRPPVVLPDAGAK